MTKKIISMVIAACMCLLCSCDPTPAKVDTSAGSFKAENQYVIAMNPSVAFEDGNVTSIRNDAAKSMSADLEANSTNMFYDSTEWQWIYSDENGQWNKRLVRQVTPWRNGSGKTAKGVPYAYTLNDNGTASLAVFDSSKMAIEGCAEGQLSESGILMSFTEGKEEAICYTASADCVVTFSDVSSGNIAVVNEIAGLKTAFFDQKNAASSIVLRVYRNNRIYWQGILDKNNTAVKFPYLSGIKLSEGDSLFFTAEATSNVEGIATGNCDLPATSTIVKEYVRNEYQVQVEDEVESKPETFPLMNEGIPTFTIVSPKGIASHLVPVISDFRNTMSKRLGESVDMKNDEFDSSEQRILLYKTRFAPSVDALNEIKSTRTAHDGDFIIRVVDDDIVIAADNEISLEMAIEFFLANYCKDSESEIPVDLNYISSNYNPIKDVKISGKSIDDFSIVYSHVASYMETSAAKYVRKEITRIVGKCLDMVNDEEAIKANEILIGDTNRTSSTYSVTANTNTDNKYTIRVKNGKLAVLGTHVYGVNAGSIQLAEILSTTSSLADDYYYEGEYDGSYSLTGGYKLAWTDEFNGNKLSSTWISKATGSDETTNHYGGVTRISKANNVVKDGALHQYIIREGNDMTYGHLYSTGPQKMMFKWGYLEIRVKLPLSEGIGSSFWTQGDLAGGFLEIDIYETFGNPFNVKANLHTWEDSGHKNLLGGTGNTLNTSAGVTKPYGYEYHTVGVEWLDDICTFMVDGEFSVSFDCSSSIYDCFDKAAWLILGASPCSADYGKVTKPDFNGDVCSIDWIHIYQKDEEGSFVYVKN